MNHYILLHQTEPWIRRTTLQAYLNDGYSVFFEDARTLLVYMRTDPVDTQTEATLLRLIIRSFRRSIRHSAVLDLSDLMNKHIARLTDNHCSSLKFHDPFNDELKQLIVRTLV